jgi:tRNA splicing endonuclease
MSSNNEICVLEIGEDEFLIEDISRDFSGCIFSQFREKTPISKKEALEKVYEIYKQFSKNGVPPEFGVHFRTYRHKFSKCSMQKWVDDSKTSKYSSN